MSKEHSLYQLALPSFDVADTPITIVSPEQKLREALAPYISLPRLRRLANYEEVLHEALRKDDVPDELDAVLAIINVFLRPSEKEQVKDSADIAPLLMVEMGHLQQEQLRVVCLDGHSHIQKIHLVYQGTSSAMDIRIAEVFHEPILLNSASVILAHNHPSGEPTPSHNDIAVTRTMVEAGEILDIHVRDHIIIGKGQWLSMKEHRKGFESQTIELHFKKEG